MRSPGKEPRIETSGLKMTRSGFEMIIEIGRKKNKTRVNIIGETTGTNLKGTKIMRTCGFLIRDTSLDRTAIRVTLCPNFANCLRIPKRAVL
jgi:hypothetical protein